MPKTVSSSPSGASLTLVDTVTSLRGDVPGVVIIDPVTGLPTYSSSAPPLVVTTLQLAQITVVTGTGIAVSGVGPRWYQTLLTGTGAITATVYIDVSSDNINWVLARWTFTLSGTTSVTDGFSSSERAPYVRSRIGAITGTGAASTTTVSA